MPNLYSSLDKSTWVYQPNFTRSRARYRGTRESLKVNIEMYQVLYDIRKLYEKFDTLDTTLDLNLRAIETGYTIAQDNNLYPEDYFYPEETTFPQDNPLIILGLKDLSLRLIKLYRRINSFIIVAESTDEYPNFNVYPNTDHYPS